MKIQELKYNLYLADFKEVEQEIFHLLKLELDKFGIITYEDLPRVDYIKLLKYFTLATVCKNYSKLQHKKNTIFYVNSATTNTDILKFVKEIKKRFPILFYITEEQLASNDPAVHTEIILKLKEFRYSIDYSKYSFNKIKKFCKANDLESLTEGFKL